MIITGLAVGAVLGLILQRGRFCITGAFRDLWVSRSWRWFTALLVAVAVQAVGVGALTALDVIAPEIPPLSVPEGAPPEPTTVPARDSSAPGWRSSPTPWRHRPPRPVSWPR